MTIYYFENYGKIDLKINFVNNLNNSNSPRYLKGYEALRLKKLFKG